MSWTFVCKYISENWIEILGFLTAVISIWLTTKRRIVSWPISIVSDLAYLVVFYQARLFANALLQIGNLPLAFYGWWFWVRGVREEGEVRVVRLPRLPLFYGLVAGAVGGVALGYWMKHIHASLPWMDAILASYSVVASWWGVQKHIANWWLWIAVDLVYIGEYVYNNLYVTAVLYAGLVALAMLGLREWQRAAQAVDLKAQQATK